MPAPIRLHLTQEERAEVARRYEATDAAETRTRYQMVLLAADGQTAPQIARVVRRSRDTVVRVLRRYRTGGADAVPHRPHPGRPRLVTAAWEAELWRVIDLDPHTVGVASATWTTPLLADYLGAQTGHHAGDETVRLYLHRGHYVCKRPTWTLERKAAEQVGWAKNGSRWRSS